MKSRIYLLALFAALLFALLFAPAWAQEPEPYTPGTDAMADPPAVTAEHVDNAPPLEAVVPPVVAEAVEDKAEEVVEEKAPDIFGQLAWRYGLLIVLVLGATEGVGRAFGASKDRAAMVLGPLCAMIAHGGGLIAAPGGQFWGFAVAGMMGFLLTMGGGMANDYLIKPLQRRAAPI